MIEINKIHNMDCLEGLKLIEDNSIDLILTDPPYNLNYRSNHGSDEFKEKIQNAQEWDNDFDIKPYIPEFMRILKDNSYCLIFGCEENIALMKELGCYQVLVWDKQHNGMGDLSDWGIGYEFIFYFRKGNPKLRGHRINGVLNIKHIGYFDMAVHPTQKSLKLIKYIVEKCSDKGNIVFDGFMGSGTTALACKQLERDFIGFELNKDYIESANKRLEQTNLLDFNKGKLHI